MPWNTYGEGPTRMAHVGAFSDTKEKLAYTARDIRFTVRDNILYAMTFDWPEKEFVIESTRALYPGEVRSVELLGSQGELKWEMTPDGIKIERPDQKPGDHVLRLQDHAQLQEPPMCAPSVPSSRGMFPTRREGELFRLVNLARPSAMGVAQTCPRVCRLRIAQDELLMACPLSLAKLVFR